MKISSNPFTTLGPTSKVPGQEFTRYDLRFDVNRKPHVNHEGLRQNLAGLRWVYGLRVVYGLRRNVNRKLSP